MRVSVLVFESVEVNKSSQKRRAECEAKKLCVACLEPLDGTRTIRGCHFRCYQATMRAIKVGATTEKQRIAEGKLLEAESGGRAPSNAVTLDVRKVATA